MRKSRFAEEQIVAIPKKSGAGTPTKELVRRHGVSANTFYSWRKKYGGLDVSDARRLEQLEDENRRLKKIVAEQTLDIAAIEGGLARKR